MSATPYLPPGPDLEADWFSDDPFLRRFLSARLAPDAWKALEPRLAALGRDAPRRIDAWARQADARGPRLEGNDVVFDPSYRELQRAAREHEVFSYHSHRGGAPRLATFALGYLYGQAESGYYCPACMTDGAALVLETHAPRLARELGPRLLQREVDGAFEGAMLLTEPQGGSDVGATRTSARRDGTAWRLTGQKWFASNANAEVVLTLARMPGAGAGTSGLGLFLVRTGGNAGFVRVRLKEKLGVRSMATAEVELRDCLAELVAPEGAGFKAMADMVNLSRLYNAVASIAIARRALREGQRNAEYRAAFGKKLADHPLYLKRLAELSNDVRGAVLVTFDAADALDQGDRALLRALTPLAKAQTARLAVEAASAACEMLGGNGYVEEWVTPRLLRDAQVLPIWEGTTHVQALDLLRAATKEGALEALREDSLRRAPGLAAEWARMPALREATALRLLERCYHLRAAALLAEDAARDGDAVAGAHARAYAARHLRGEDAAEGEWRALALDQAFKSP